MQTPSQRRVAVQSYTSIALEAGEQGASIVAASAAAHFSPRVSWASEQDDAKARAPAVLPPRFTSLFVAAGPATEKVKRVFFSGQTST